MHHRVRGAVLVGTFAAMIVPEAAFAQGEPNDNAEAGEAGAPEEPIVLEPEPDPKKPPPAAIIATPGDKPADNQEPPPRFTFSPFGFLRLQYKVVRNDPNVAFVGRDDGFELQNARFGVRGRLGDKLLYKFSLDGAVDERTQVNVPDGKLRVGMKDAYADGFVAGKVAVRGGYFETLVDPDLDEDTERAFVDKPIEVRGVRPTQGYQAAGLTPGRSLGAAIRLDPEPPKSGAAFGFELAVQNGADEFASDNDNDTPAASASALVRLPNRSWFVASARFNRRTVGELPFRQDEDDLEATAGARYLAGPVAINAGAVVRRTMFPTTAGPVQDAFGVHAQLIFMVPGKNPFGVGYRFGILDASSLIVTDRVMEHTAGAVLAMPAYRMRFQVQFTLVMEEGARTLTNDRAQVAAELAL